MNLYFFGLITPHTICSAPWWGREWGESELVQGSLWILARKAQQKWLDNCFKKTSSLSYRLSESFIPSDAGHSISVQHQTEPQWTFLRHRADSAHGEKLSFFGLLRWYVTSSQENNPACIPKGCSHENSLMPHH